MDSFTGFHGVPEVEGDKGVDGEGTFTVIANFPLIRESHEMKPGVSCRFSCLDMRIINREEVEFVNSVTFLGQFGDQTVGRAVVFVCVC